MSLVFVHFAYMQRHPNSPPSSYALRGAGRRLELRLKEIARAVEGGEAGAKVRAFRGSKAGWLRSDGKANVGELRI